MELKEAFETKALENALKAEGLPVLEETVEKIVKVVFDWTKSSLKIHPNPYLKFAVPVVEAVEPLALGQIDKIDGLPG